jgi:gliding motility-associated-like protein
MKSLFFGMMNKIKMNKIAYIFCTFLMLCFCKPSAYATHIVGGDMTYLKKGPNLFQITLNLRRDCYLGANNAPFDANAKIRIYRSNGSIFLQTTIPYMADDTLNNYVESNCGFEGTQVCVHETRYIKDLELPFTPGGYIIAYQRCCRNETINNIESPLETGATYFVHIPEIAFTTQNSSPFFKRWPDVYICADKDLDFDASVTDPDKDSVVYELCTPKIGLTKPEPEGFPSAPPYTDLFWKAPYGLTNLMGGTPLKIDPKTGRLTAKPNIVGQFVVGICVSEYRNGVKIGEIRRDFQYNVRVCSPPPTAIFDAPANKCFGDYTVTFKNNSIVANTYEWNFNYPNNNSAFKTTVKDPTFTFPGPGEYKVQLVVVRGSDQCKDEEIKTIKISDKPFVAAFNYDIKSCNDDGSTTVVLTDNSASLNPGLLTQSYSWNVSQAGKTFSSTTNPFELKINPADFSVNYNATSIEQCVGSKNETVSYASKALKTDFTYSFDGCNDANLAKLSLKNISQGLNNNFVITGTNWSVLSPDGTATHTGKDVLLELPHKQYKVIMSVQTDKKCTAQLIKDINLTDSLPKVDFNYAFTGCNPTNLAKLSLNNVSQALNSNFKITNSSWSIFSPEGIFSASGNNALAEVPHGLYKVLLSMQTDRGCSGKLLKEIDLRDSLPKINFDLRYSGCNDQNVATLFLSDKSQGANTEFTIINQKWTVSSTNGTVAVTGMEASVPVANGIYNVILEIGTTRGCMAKLEKSIDVTDSIPAIDFDVALLGCDAGSNLLLNLKDKSPGINTNFKVTSEKWIVTSSAGMQEYSGLEPSVNIPRGNYSVKLEIGTDRNCRAQIIKDFKSSDFVPNTNFDFALDGCNTDNKAVVKLVEKTKDSLLYSTINAFTWTVGANTYMGKDVAHIMPQTDSVLAKLEITFANNCKASIEKLINVDKLNPETDYSFAAASCPTDSTVALKFDVLNTGNNGYTVKDVRWFLGDSTNLKVYSGASATAIVPKGRNVRAVLSTTFENGCIDVVKNDFYPGTFATATVLKDSLVICPKEQKMLLSNGNPNFTYTWSPTTGLDLTKPHDPILSGTTDQVYKVTVSDGICNVVRSIKVDILESINILVDGSDFTCDGKVAINAFGAVGPGKYEWSDKENFSSIIQEGTLLETSFKGLEKEYYVRFRGDICSANPAKLKVINQTPRFEVLEPVKICKGDTIKTANISSEVNTHINSIVWDNDPHLVSGITTLTPMVAAYESDGTSFELSFTATNQYNCSLKDNLTFNIAQNPVADFNFNVKDCDNKEVCFEVVGNNFGFSKWEFGDPASGNLNSSPERMVCHTYPATGKYTVRLSNITSICPFLPVVKEVNLNSSFQVFDKDNDVDCINTDYTLTLPAKAVGRKIVWFDAKGTEISKENNPKVNIKSDTSFILQVKDDNGCDFRDTFMVKAFKIDLSATGPTEVCDKGLYDLKAVANDGINFMYTWTPATAIVSGADGATPKVDVAKSTTFTVKAVHPSLGCIAEKEVALKTYKFNYNLVKPTLFCLNSTTKPTISVVGPESFIYEWQPSSAVVSGGNTAAPTITVKGPGHISVTVKHPTLGCVVKDSFIVTPSSISLALSAQPNGQVPKGEKVEIKVENPVTGHNYKWSNDSMKVSQVVRVFDAITYKVTATDANGCTGEAEIRLDIRPARCEEDVFFPTAFSPNEDNNNDILYVRSNYITSMELIIYNRWGQEIFNSDSVNSGWDGRFNGEELSPDVYAYYLKATCDDGTEINRKGNVSLLR